jgi:hypothetical protein
MNTEAKLEKEIYEQYLQGIAPLLVTLEVLDTEYPVEIFNEIRSTFTHIARYHTKNDQNELLSAKSHVKRATLDCYKYFCVSIMEKISAFREKYNGVNLALADNGNFLPNLDRLESEAKQAYMKAKSAEPNMDVTIDELYCLFENAYLAHDKLNKFLEDSTQAILFAITNSKRNASINRISLIVGVAGLLVGIISVVIAILPKFM